MLRSSVINAFLILAALLASPAHAQDGGRPPVGGVSSPRDAMIFYLARGPSGACGAGCSEWIAAEGTVQWDSYKRLLAVLDRLGGRKAPVILNVRGGGSLKVATSLGKIIRDRGLDVGAGRTMVSKCAGAGETECFALKRGGEALDAKIDASSVECVLDCVLILAGGVNRTLPADARVVIGAMRIRSRLAPNVSEQHQEGLQSYYTEQFRLYLIQMGVRAELIDIVERNSEAQRATLLLRDDWLRLRLVTALEL